MRDGLDFPAVSPPVGGSAAAIASGGVVEGIAETVALGAVLVAPFVATIGRSFRGDSPADWLSIRCEARIAALERLVGKLTLENEFLKGASGHARLPRSASTCVVAGPAASRLPKDAD